MEPTSSTPSVEGNSDKSGIIDAIKSATASVIGTPAIAPEVGVPPVPATATAPVVALNFFHKCLLRQSTNGTGRWMYVVNTFEACKVKTLAGTVTEGSSRTPNQGNTALPPDSRTMTLLDMKYKGFSQDQILLEFGAEAIMDVRNGNVDQLPVQPVTATV